MMQIRLEQLAEFDLKAAYDWYEAQQKGVGLAFIEAVDTTFAKIGERPESFPEIKPGIRRAVVQRFPYGVFYSIEDKSVYVIAVMHAKRSTAKWESRRP